MGNDERVVVQVIRKVFGGHFKERIRGLERPQDHTPSAVGVQLEEVLRLRGEADVAQLLVRQAEDRGGGDLLADQQPAHHAARHVHLHGEAGDRAAHGVFRGHGYRFGAAHQRPEHLPPRRVGIAFENALRLGGKRNGSEQRVRQGKHALQRDRLARLQSDRLLRQLEGERLRIQGEGERQARQQPVQIALVLVLGAEIPDIEARAVQQERALKARHGPVVVGIGQIAARVGRIRLRGAGPPADDQRLPVDIVVPDLLEADRARKVVPDPDKVVLHPRQSVPDLRQLHDRAAVALRAFRGVQGLAVVGVEGLPAADLVVEAAAHVAVAGFDGLLMQLLHQIVQGLAARNVVEEGALTDRIRRVEGKFIPAAEAVGLYVDAVAVAARAL